MRKFFLIIFPFLVMGCYNNNKPLQQYYLEVSFLYETYTLSNVIANVSIGLYDNAKDSDKFDFDNLGLYLFVSNEDANEFDLANYYLVYEENPIEDHFGYTRRNKTNVVDSFDFKSKLSIPNEVFCYNHGKIVFTYYVARNKEDLHTEHYYCEWKSKPISYTTDGNEVSFFDEK